MAIALEEPPKWEHWNSPSARQARQDHKWLEALRAKADRLIFQPLDRFYRCDRHIDELSALADVALSFSPKEPDGPIEFLNGPGELGSALTIDTI